MLTAALPHVRSRAPRRFAAAALLALALVGSLGACGDDDGGTGPRGDGILGTYQLHTVNGAALPTNVSVLGLTARVNSGRLELQEGRQFLVVLNLSVGPIGQTARGTGDFVRSGNTLTFTGQLEGTPTALTATGTVDGDELTLDIDIDNTTLTGEFRKQ